MSFYNMLNGANPLLPRLLEMVELDAADVPRFRDVWLNADFTQLTIFTRTGGGNRDEYTEENAALAAHPLYISDEDDDFDSTYAKFHFTVSEAERAKLIAEIEEAFNHSDNKDTVIAALTKDSTAKWKEVWDAFGVTPEKKSTTA